MSDAKFERLSEEEQDSIGSAIDAAEHACIGMGHQIKIPPQYVMPVLLYACSGDTADSLPANFRLWVRDKIDELPGIDEQQRAAIRRMALSND